MAPRANDLSNAMAEIDDLAIADYWHFAWHAFFTAAFPQV